MKKLGYFQLVNSDYFQEEDIGHSEWKAWCAVTFDSTLFVPYERKEEWGRLIFEIFTFLLLYIKSIHERMPYFVSSYKSMLFFSNWTVFFLNEWHETCPKLKDFVKSTLFTKNCQVIKCFITYIYIYIYIHI